MLIKDNSKNIECLLKQYEICVNMADKISERRGNANKFYSALLLAFLSAITAFITKNLYEYYPVLLILLVLQITLCIIWIVSLNTYKNLNKAKFDVINEMENNLLVQAYTLEWKYFKKYQTITISRIEISIPIVFILASISIIIYILMDVFA